MKIVQAANGQRNIKISKKNWESIGVRAGWMKKAQLETSEEKPNNKDGQIQTELNKIRDSLSKIKVEGDYAINDGESTQFLNLAGLMDYFEKYFYDYSDQLVPEVENIQVKKAMISKGGEPTQYLQISMNVWPFYVDMPANKFMIASASDVQRAHQK
jgi:hypothetical protein